MIPKWAAEFILALAVGLIEVFKPKPEELERMKVNEKTKALIKFINDGYPGYILSDPTRKNEWGDTATHIK
jgi:hypothetical protein